MVSRQAEPTRRPAHASYNVPKRTVKQKAKSLPKSLGKIIFHTATYDQAVNNP